jgi:hypothetical protein
MESKVDNVQNVSAITTTTSTPALADINSDKPQIILDDSLMVKNPTNILSQDKSKITTNPFIPNEQKIKEITEIQKDSNRILKAANKKTNLLDTSINELIDKISKSFLDFLEDVFKKPNDMTYLNYIQVILLKEDRYIYLGFILIFFASVASIIN